MLRRVLAVSLLVTLVSCSDSVGPWVPNTSEDSAQLVAAKSKDPQPSQDTVIRILRHSPSAPPLSSYELGFWAVRGKATRVLVSYQSVDDAEGSVEPKTFLKFDIPKGGLESGPGGTPLAVGDSVWITLSIDPVEFRFDFEPSGLRFNEREPVSLAVWYGLADGPVNRMTLDFLYRPQVGASWSPIPAKQVRAKKWIITVLRHFSGYAVSWRE